ncbi:SurA N-terminal domain-containing protein [Metabacillus halosaccharovorans]|uniref:SurA N-terminal domain-containing protein n=1 Tax=Metabacillus halosaccharovorans TaxID=930124 RepID=UPI001C1F3723|nr:SurA N-terminal domain-containing protein [Metabacillus halosaccharovorans]MBU7591771.1 peptidylprolyl isomerase [Metabacillus halosaccharovorans]
MKKFLLALFVGILSLSLAACNNDEDKAKEKEKETEEKATGEEAAAVDPEEMQKKLDAQKVEKDTVVAIVNGKEIKGNEYNDALSMSQMQFTSMGQDPTTEELAKQLKDYTLESLVGQTLIMQEIEKKGYEAKEEDINKQLDTLKANYENDDAFNEALKANNLTLDELKAQIADTVKYDQYVKNDLKVEEVTDKEVKEYYDKMTSSGEESAETPKYEDVKDTLKTNLEGQKTQEKLAAKVEELRETAKIELKL